MALVCQFKTENELEEMEYIFRNQQRYFKSWIEEKELRKGRKVVTN